MSATPGNHDQSHDRLSDDQSVKLNTWLHDLEEGTLSPADQQSLESLLKESEAARRHYVHRMHIGAALCRFGDESQGAGDQEGQEREAETSRILPMPGAIVAHRPWPLSAKLAMAASLALCASTLAWVVWSRPIPTSMSSNGLAQAEVTDAGCAVLVDVAGAKWAEDSHHWQVGMAVPAGKLRLASGVARLEFYSGASVTLEGSSELEIVSVNEARCQFGQMRVHVPPHARGFKLMTPDAKVIDLGTEFGLKVNESGKSDVHVFEGEVEVYPDAGPDKLSLKTGARWNALDGAGITGADPLAFADFASIHAQSQDSDERRRLSWRKGIQKFLEDPRLLVGYTFEPVNAWDRSVRNQSPAAGEGSHGSVVGAQWAQGRWRGKQALDFKSPGDRVRLAVGGEYQAITLSAWVQVGGVDRNFNSLFLTDTWTPGNPHWQIVRDGSVALGVHEFNGRSQHVFNSPVIFGPENLGVWFHLASTFDLRTGTGRHYVNGKVVSEQQFTKIPPDTRIRMGSGELGNWGLPEGKTPRTEVRSFNGRMDEFLLFKEALSSDEVARIYELGRP